MILTVGYMISRGLAKSGSSQPYDEDRSSSPQSPRRRSVWGRRRRSSVVGGDGHRQGRRAGVVLIRVRRSRGNTSQPPAAADAEAKESKFGDLAPISVDHDDVRSSEERS